MSWEKERFEMITLLNAVAVLDCAKDVTVVGRLRHNFLIILYIDPIQQPALC